MPTLRNPPQELVFSFPTLGRYFKDLILVVCDSFRLLELETTEIQSANHRITVQ